MKLDKEELKKSLLLYAVTDRSWCKNTTLFEQVEQTLKGGTTIVQLREKNISPIEFEIEAVKMQKLCKSYNVPLIINDDVILAKKINADGIHVGQDDMNTLEARKFIGPDMILGVSVQTVEEAIIAQNEGADYLGVGAVFPTSSKKDAIDVSLETLKQICDAVSIPVIAIGGISINNVEKLANTGIDGIAVISAIFAQEDIFSATKQLKLLAQKIV